MQLHSNLSSDKIEFKGHTIQVSVLILQLKQLGWQGGIILHSIGLSVNAKYLSSQIHDSWSSDKVELIGHKHFLEYSLNSKNEGQMHYFFPSKIKLFMHSHSNLLSDKIEFKGHTKQVSVLILQLKQLGWQEGIILQTKGFSIKAK